MAKFSILVGTCLNDRVPVDPMPTANAVNNPRAFVSLGDWIYGDGTSDRNAMSMDAVMFPRGSGMVLTIPAAVGGVIPTGAVTVTNGGTGHPVSSTTFLFWVRDATTGADTAWGYATTNGSGVVTAASISYGGRAGEYLHAAPRAFTEDVDLWTLAHPQAWPRRSKHFVQATQAMQQFKALKSSTGMPWFLTPDDHEAWNGGFPGAYLSKAPTTVTTQAQSYAFWQTASDGVRQLLDQDFDNPAWSSPVTPYVPNGLTGLGLAGTESFFKVRYFFRDFDRAGVVTTDPRQAVLRLIFPDLLFEKGDYTTGSDDSSRNLISPTQEAWLDTVQADAVAAGIQSIGIMSSKDRFAQNSDGWISFQTQFNRIASNIQSKGYPTWWVTGDRHVPHAARMRVSRGDVADMHIVCPTALGATSDAITPYKQMDWADQSPDVPVVGSIEIDPEGQMTTISVHDMGTARVKYAIKIPFGQRKASRTYMAAAKISRRAPSTFSGESFTRTAKAALDALVSGDGNAPATLDATNAAAYNGATVKLAAGATLTVHDGAWALLTAELIIKVAQSGSASLAFSGTAQKENSSGTSASTVTLAASGVYALTRSPTGSPLFRLNGGASL